MYATVEMKEEKKIFIPKSTANGTMKGRLIFWMPEHNSCLKVKQLTTEKLYWGRMKKVGE